MKIGLIGCGKQASKHIKGLKAFSSVEIFVTDENKTLALDFAEAEGVQYIESFIKFPKDLEGLIICTPLRSHFEYICLGLELNDYINIFCEKPLCETLNEAKEIEKTMVCHSQQFIQVGYVYRYAPVFEEAYKLLHDSMVLEKPLFASFRLGGRGSHQEWKHKKDHGGGAKNEMFVHMLDLALWLFGSIRGWNYIAKDQFLYERKIGEEIVVCDAEDFIFLECTSISGVRIHIQADMITPAFSQHLEIQAENGSFFGSIQPDMPSYLYLKEDRGGYNKGKTIFNFGKRNFFDAQMTDFIYCLEMGKKPRRNTLYDSIALMEFLEEVK